MQDRLVRTMPRVAGQVFAFLPPLLKVYLMVNANCSPSGQLSDAVLSRVCYVARTVLFAMLR